MREQAVLSAVVGEVGRRGGRGGKGGRGRRRAEGRQRERGRFLRSFRRMGGVCGERPERLEALGGRDVERQGRS